MNREMKFGTLILLTLLTFNTFAQSFTAETGYLYLGENNTELSGGLEILSGSIKKGEKIEIYAPSGRKFTATITKIMNKDRQEANLIKAGEYGYFDLKFTENPSTGKDYVTKGYKVYPAGFTPAGGAVAKNDAEKKSTFTATLDGKVFKADLTYKGASLWRKGVKNFAYDKPYLQLQFGSILSPDERALTVQVFNPKESPAKYTPKDMEVNFSGAEDGLKEHTTIYGFVNGKADTDFTLEITKWQSSGSKAIISGKLYGALREVKILGRASKTNTFENGSFENVEVEIFNEQQDLKEMMKASGGGKLLKNE